MLLFLNITTWIFITTNKVKELVSSFCKILLLSPCSHLEVGDGKDLLYTKVGTVRRWDDQIVDLVTLF